MTTTTRAHEAVQAALPACRVAVMPGQRHAAIDTGTQLFTEEVLRFLGRFQETKHLLREQPGPCVDGGVSLSGHDGYTAGREGGLHRLGGCSEGLGAFAARKEQRWYVKVSKALWREDVLSGGALFSWDGVRRFEACPPRRQ